MVDEEHGGLGDTGGPPVQLDAVELADGKLLLPRDVQGHVGLAFAFADSHDDVGLNLAELAVSDDEEVAGTTRWVAQETTMDTRPRLAAGATRSADTPVD